MPDDPSENDLKAIWQNQPTEPSTMTLKLIRNKAQALHAKTRWELIKGLSVPLLVIAVSAYAYNVAQFRDPIERTAFMVAIMWSLIGQYFLHKGMWSAKVPGDAALSTGLEYYRQEVERRRYLFSRTMPWNVGPALLATGALASQLIRSGNGGHYPTVNPKMIPFLILLALWFVGLVVLRMRQQRELQREIDELNDTETAAR